MSYEKRIKALPNSAVDNGNSSSVAMISLIDAAWIACDADKEIAKLKAQLANSIPRLEVIKELHRAQYFFEDIGPYVLVDNFENIITKER